MKNQKRYLACFGGFIAAAAVACIIPDKDIVVIVDDCGEEWVASTPGAEGQNGLDQWVEIKTDGDEPKWISESYCLTPAQGSELADSNSELYGDVLDHIILTCKLRAVEMGLNDDTCEGEAAISYAGTCYNSGGCDTTSHRCSMSQVLRMASRFPE